MFRSFLHPAINSGIQSELVESNPFYKLAFPKQVKKPIQCYEPEEIKLILDTFAKDIYNPKSSRYKNSYYYLIEVIDVSTCRLRLEFFEGICDLELFLIDFWSAYEAVFPSKRYRIKH